MITIEQARHLAVCYRAFSATPFQNDHDIIVFGEMLREAQIETGVVLYPFEELNRWLDDAHRRAELNA